MVEFEDGWCENVSKLKTIKIDDSNPNFKLFNNQFLLGKSSSEKVDFDVLVFSVRDIKRAKIPNFIEIIGPFAFHDCFDLQEIEFEPNSKLRKFEKYSFENTAIEKICIPASVTDFCEGCFYQCKELKSIDIPANSNLQRIGCISISSTKIESLYFPSKLNKLDNEWCYSTEFLNSIEVDKNIDRFQLYDGNFIIEKSTSEKVDFDTLVFARRNFARSKNPKLYRNHWFNSI